MTKPNETASTAPGTTAPEVPATGTPAATGAPAAGDAAPSTDAAGTAPAGTEALTLEQAMAKLEEWKGHSRDWEAKAKANKTAKEELDRIEAEKLTGEQRLQKELDELKADKAKSDRQLLVASVASAKGVPAALLTGSTKEELEAAADVLLAFRGEVKPPANDAAASGAKGTTITPAGTQITSRDQLKGMSPAEIRQAKADGRLNALLGK